MSYRTIDDMNALKLNDKAVVEILEVKGGIMTAIKFLTKYIGTLHYDSGRKVRSERQESMIIVMSALLSFMINGKHGDCSPSMRTIAYVINPKLERITENDSPEEARRKEKLLAPLLMNVQRAIKALEKFGIIKIHEYRADTNQDTGRYANFYYEIVPISILCEGFAELLKKCSKTVRAIAVKFKKTVYAGITVLLAISKRTKEDKLRSNGRLSWVT